jgi:hypothetical protein
MACTGDDGCNGDELGDTSMSVTGVKSPGEDASCCRSERCTDVSMANLGSVSGACGRRTTFGEADRVGGARCGGRIGFGGRSMDCNRSLRFPI